MFSSNTSDLHVPKEEEEVYTDFNHFSSSVVNTNQVEVIVKTCLQGYSFRQSTMNQNVGFT